MAAGGEDGCAFGGVYFEVELFDVVRVAVEAVGQVGLQAHLLEYLAFGRFGGFDVAYDGYELWYGVAVEVDGAKGFAGLLVLDDHAHFAGHFAVGHGHYGKGIAHGFGCADAQAFVEAFKGYVGRFEAAAVYLDDVVAFVEQEHGVFLCAPFVPYVNTIGLRGGAGDE